MLLSESGNQVGRVIVRHGKYVVQEMIMTREKTHWLWTEMSKCRTLFNDLTRGNVDDFTANILNKHSIWFEVLDETGIIGVIYFTEMYQIVDCNAHVIFFDLKVLEKAQLCRAVAQWMFNNFPLARISAVIPKLYRFTISLTRLTGFKKEGVRRKATLMGGNWIDEVILGLLREEAFNG